RKFKGPFYGFEHVELARNHADEYHVGQHYALWMEEKGFTRWRDCFQAPGGNRDRQQWTWNIPEAFHYDAWIAERTNALIDQYSAAGDPFLIWASFLDPHPPYLVPEPWDRMYDPATLTLPEGVPGEHDRNPPHFQKTQEEHPDFSAWQEKDGAGTHGFQSHLMDRDTRARNLAVYYGMISLMDKYIGKILDHLDERGLTENTLVVFTTDHGHFFGQHGLIAKGAFHYEDMIKIPLIAALPGVIPEGRTSPALQSLVDLAPTFLNLAGLSVPRTMTGVNQLEVWRGGKAAARDHVLVENRHQPTTIHVKTYVNERYKLTVYFNRPYGELFDLQTDPGEIHNLWDEATAQSLKLDLLLKMMHAQMGIEPVWMPRVASA
ncbi:MAG: sulfatase-like hydrolase/transferase, partial [Kiritimatiellia bacterium]|nr:sulfatase-like hydrolase/transferase [Kiritimatiellia bacterium]